MPARILDRFFCARTCNEEEHGIIENDDLPLHAWRHALEFFDEKNVELKATRFVKAELFNPRSIAKYLAAFLLGGNISGICRKRGAGNGNRRSIRETLICPECKEAGTEMLLSGSAPTLQCRHCGNSYPFVDDVLFLFTYPKFRELYLRYSPPV